MKKEAELKMLERIITGLMSDKKELEDRIEEIVSKDEMHKSRSAEEHHNTVKYFENLVA